MNLNNTVMEKPTSPHHQIPDWVLSKMKSYCAFQERSIFEVKTKLKTFRLQDEVYDAVINKLIEDDFLNEERFSKAFARGKLRINKWGRNKIFLALQQKKVPELFILEGLNEIDDDEYHKVLHDLLEKKARELSEVKDSTKVRKLINFALGRGFELQLAREVAADIFGKDADY